MDFDKDRRGTGTKEWSEFSYNISQGCSHGCLYCYARQMALRNGRIRTAADWQKEIPNHGKVSQSNRRFEGVVMFPSSHDISPAVLPAALQTLKNLLAAGNRILIVTKPHLSVIRTLCQSLKSHRDIIQFRFTIGSLDESICAFWEPGAPAPQERIEALKQAFESGFQTSVSAEPMLDDVGRMCRLVEVVASQVTDTIWLGKMNAIQRRVDPTIPGIKQAVALIQNQQSDANIRRLYSMLKANGKIRWKDSIKEVLRRNTDFVD
jgi:DNA repair photolyase